MALERAIGAARPILAIGLMSGTSLDGVDAALIETDGLGLVRPLGAATRPYAPEFRARLRQAISGALDPATLEAELTDLHAEAVEALLATLGRSAGEIGVAGFHGQTVLHRPEKRQTWQIGDGPRLAARIGVDVVYDFRTADVAAGGEGAPLAPVYHAALAGAAAERPLAIVNIGGVANVTWIGRDGRLIACDVGPGNGPIDDWVQRTDGRAYDADGALARSGEADGARIAAALDGAFFGRPPPKSLDRLDFTDALADGLSPADGAATLTEFTAAAIARSAAIFPEAPARWLVTGGGRANGYLMERLAALAAAPVAPIETIGADGDRLEAEAFAYMAARSLAGAPISFPETTGAPRPMTGGRLARAPAAAA